MVLNKSNGLYLLDAKDNFKHLNDIKVLTALPVLEDPASISIAFHK